MRPKAGPAKRARRAMKRMTAEWREAFVARMPAPVRRHLGPGAQTLHMLVFDHLWLRLAYPNRHRLSDGVWRSAQPLPHQIRALSRKGLRTIVNLRGRMKTSTYELERAACAVHGVTLIDFPMKSRGAPTRAVILAASDLIGRLDEPVLFHCKSGADRAGLMSALYLHFKHGVPIAEARRQLAFRFGHIRQADTGILDAFFERYLADTAATSMSFLEWVETTYDADDLQHSFKAQGWANRLVRGVLRRE
ncbi:MAG: phosphatase domain-containing putative toxin [Hyphomicrobium sp.]